MAWETRKRGGPYYTRSRREGGRVVRDYLGRGETAHLIARMDELDRQQQEDERETERRLRQEIEAREREVGAQFAEVEAVLRQVLEAAGYHRHNRGAWRKRRDRHQDH